MAPSTLTPDRPTFRHIVADVAARAKARLPEAVNGRVESAVKLVLSHDVAVHDDGTVEVGSSSDPLKTYTVAGKACDCQDFAYGKAPDGWCQHRLAAAIHTRVQEQLAAQTPPPVIPDVVEPWGDNDLEDAPQSTPVATGTVLQPLPEAPVSITLKGTRRGQDVLVTLRGTDFASVQAQVDAAAQWLDAPRAPAQDTGQAQPADDTPQCPTHGAMKRSKKGKGWYCSAQLPDNSWCRERRAS